MKSTMKFQCIYSEEHMIELLIDISKLDISTNISCYTQINKLSELCKDFVRGQAPFTWFIGTKEYAYFSMNVEPYDRFGHIKVAIIMVNNKDNLAIMRCEFFILLDLGLIEEIGEKIRELISDENASFVIQQN